MVSNHFMTIFHTSKARNAQLGRDVDTEQYKAAHYTLKTINTATQPLHSMSHSEQMTVKTETRGKEKFAILTVVTMKLLYSCM
jgi:hypothetical protein